MKLWTSFFTLLHFAVIVQVCHLYMFLVSSFECRTPHVSFNLDLENL